MNGIEKIIDHIKCESQAECKAIEDEASAECARIHERYELAGRDEYARLIEQGERAAAQRAERLASVAQLESKKKILATQQGLMNDAFALAVKKFRELPDDKYVLMLARLAAEAAMRGDETLFLSQSDIERFSAAIISGANAALIARGKMGALTLSGEAADISGGFILRGGDIEANCSLDALVAQYRNELSPQVSAELFD